MTDSILKYGAFHLLFGTLSRKHFELAPIWCEYQVPSELDDIDVPDEWIQANLFDQLDESNERVYYSTSEDIDYSSREFLNIFCDLVLDGHQLQGYVFVIEGKVNSVSVFIGDEEVDFYSAEIFSEFNIKTLNDISEHLQTRIKNVDSIEYTTKNCLVNPIEPKGEFKFPVE